MYELLALDLDSIKPPDEDEGSMEGGGPRDSRDHLATDSIWSKLPPLSVPVSASPVSRVVNRYSVALDMR